MSLLELQKGIIYGPIDSRRLGKSLGLNIMPTGYKLCPFNCVYCHYGWTDKRTVDLKDYEADLPAFEDVVSEVERAAKSSLDFRLITFSGKTLSSFVLSVGGHLAAAF